MAGLISAHRANREDYTDVLLALMNFEIWACMYIDGRSHEDVTGGTEGSHSMNILYVCHRFPFPPKRGGKIRPFNMIRHFSEAGHKVTVCSLARSDDEAAEGRGIAPHCERFEMAVVSNPFQTLRMVARLPTPTPSSLGYFYSRDLQRAIDAALERERFDLIFVHCSSVAQYVEHVRDIPKILDFGDMDSQKWLEYGKYKPFRSHSAIGSRARSWSEEKRLARCFDMSTATTRAEWETLESYGAAAHTDWFQMAWMRPSSSRTQRATTKTR